MTQEQIKQIKKLTYGSVYKGNNKNEWCILVTKVFGYDKYFFTYENGKITNSYSERYRKDGTTYPFPKKGLIEIPKIMGWV